MTRKQYKHVCRYKCILITKLIMSNSIFMLYLLLSYLEAPEWSIVAVMTYTWIHATDWVYYLVESIYKLNHDKVSYK